MLPLLLSKLLLPLLLLPLLLLLSMLLFSLLLLSLLLLLLLLLLYFLSCCCCGKWCTVTTAVILQKSCFSTFHCLLEKIENEQKEAGNGPSYL